MLGILLVTNIAPAIDIQVQAALLSDSRLSLSWNIQPSHVYRLQFKTSLAQSDWLNVPNDVIGFCDGGYMPPRILLTTNQLLRFFRVADIGTTTNVPIGFQAGDGKWRLFYEFSMKLNTNYTSDMFVTGSGFVLRLNTTHWDLTDGQSTGDQIADHFNILSDLFNDERVEFVYPGLTDSTFGHHSFYGNNLLVKPYNSNENLDALFAQYHLGNVHYLGFIGWYSADLTRKQDDPFVIAANLKADPRIQYADVSFSGEPRDYPCP